MWPAAKKLEVSNVLTLTFILLLIDETKHFVLIFNNIQNLTIEATLKYDAPLHPDFLTYEQSNLLRNDFLRLFAREFETNKARDILET